MTIITETAGAERRRADLIGDLQNLIDRLAVMGEAGIPETISSQLPVPAGLGHEGKLAWLERVAAEWQTETVSDGMGGRRAELRCGSARLVASVASPDRSVSGYEARAAAHGLRSSIGANGATA